MTTAAQHGLKVMRLLFDSCFGVSPSLESRHIWVANPGPDRMAPRWWPESDQYATAVVSAHAGDDRISLWDVMNEPTTTQLAATPEGKASIDAFVAHYCALVKKLDRGHPVTQGHTLRAEDFPPGAVCGHYSPVGRIWRGLGLRCFEVMPTMHDISLAQACDFALDTYAPAGPIWAPPLVAAYEPQKHHVADPDLSMKMMADAVRAWDYHIRKDSVGATAIRFWREPFGALRPDALSEANEAYSAPRTDAEQLDAVKALRAIGTQRRDEAGRFVFDSGQVVTTVVELSDPVQVRSIVPFGQSRRPASPHYADQARLYSAGQMRSAWHTWSQLRDHVGSKVVLEYRPSRP